MDSPTQIDDADAQVTEPLQEFQGSLTAPAQPVEHSQTENLFHEVDNSKITNSQKSHNDDASDTAQAQLGQKLATVEIPAISNPHEYEFLPGHHDVRCIISETSVKNQGTMYRVKLKSGEIQTIPLDHFRILNNARQALEYFYAHGYSSSSSPNASMYASEPSDTDRYLSSSSDRPRRTQRLNIRRGHFTAFFENESEETTSSDELVSSLSRRRQLRPRENIMYDDDARRGSRFSTRKRNVLRHNLRERLEDDISEHESEGRRKERFFGAKETFQRIPRDDWFRLHHRNACETCYAPGDDYAKGPLVFCQGCTSAYHQTCLGPRSSRDHLVTKVAEGQFVLQCRRCIGLLHAKNHLFPHQGCCAVCTSPGDMSNPLRERLTPRQEQQLRLKNESKDPVTLVDKSQINNVKNLLFRCAKCHRGFHFEHLPPKTVELLVPRDLMRTRFEEYSRSWQCHDCSSASGEIDAIAAWRPKNLRTLPPGSTADTLKEDDKEYLIKWKGKSYYRTTWMPGSWVWGTANGAMRRAFFRSTKNWSPFMTTEEAIPEEFLRVDIVFDVRFSDTSKERSLEGDLARVNKVREAYVKYKGLSYEDSVWESPPDPSDVERWNDFKAAYNDWARRDYIHPPNAESLRKHLVEVRKQDFKSTLVLDKQPENMTGGKIMDYQKEGLNWLYYMWFKQQNAILADEMGLGKTIQVIGLFATLIQYHRCWPFLVVAPNPTCPNWRREIRSWAPSIRVVTYFGSQSARKLANEYEMFADGSKDLACHVVVASYETMVDEASRKMLARIPWAGLVVDEGQRLKNDKSLLYMSLSRMKFPLRLLLTGTPLQNNTRELFNLIQFCDPTKDAETLETQYGTLTKDNIQELHGMIRPFFLRRTKLQVLDFLPPLVRIILPVSMSVVQKKLYKSILAKNPHLIKAIFQSGNVKRTERHNLNNILIQLRKCLCHPFVYSRAIEERTTDAATSHRHLVEASGKLQLLELMLPKLKERGHRVLIFSQFLENLDIVEDFLEGLGLLYRRLDGSMSSLEKQKEIDAFNTEDSHYFAFLLSTRSGGVGINLASADTVIIMDPDFNPHQDMQALSRAHRIGQKKRVLVFQLMTRASAEEKIIQIGKKKMALDHVLIEKIDEDDVVDLESILRHGAQALFEDDDSEDVHYDDQSVEKLLDRSQIEQEKPADDNGESQFSFARVWANDNSALEDQLEDPDKEPLPPSSTVWEKILQEREQAAAEEARLRSETLGRGKRKRNTVDYSTTGADETSLNPKRSKKRRRDRSDDEEFQAGEESDTVAEDASMASDQLEEKAPTQIKDNVVSKHSADQGTVQSFKRAPSPSKVSIPALNSNIEQRLPDAPCIACNERHPVGYCRLKLAGVEHCGLCGLAHFGYSRTCPHLHSDRQVTKMLDALKRSNESKEIVDAARKYLYGVRHNLATRRRMAAKEAAAARNRPQPDEQAQSIARQPGPSQNAAPVQTQEQHRPAQPLPATTATDPPLAYSTVNPTPGGLYGLVQNMQQHPGTASIAMPQRLGRLSNLINKYEYDPNTIIKNPLASSQDGQQYQQAVPMATVATSGQQGASAAFHASTRVHGYSHNAQLNRLAMPSATATAAGQQTRTVINLANDRPTQMQRKQVLRPSPPALD